MLLDAIHFLAFVPDMPLILLLPALHFTLVSLFMLKCLFSTRFLLLLSARIAKLGIIFFEWCILPMIDLSCFSALGFSSWSIASVFFFVEVIPSELVLYPNHIIFVRPHSHL